MTPMWFQIKRNHIFLRLHCMFLTLFQSVKSCHHRLEKLKYLWYNAMRLVLIMNQYWSQWCQAEVESSRTSSRTDFEVLGLGLEGQVLGLGLGLEASSPRKLACPRLEDSTIFWKVKILWSGWKIFWKGSFRGDRLKNFCEDLFFFFFWRALALCVLGPWPWPRAFLSLASRVSVLGKAVLGLGLGLGFFLCPWPWPRIFFVSLALALASSLVSSTPPLVSSTNLNHNKLAWRRILCSR